MGHGAEGAAEVERGLLLMSHAPAQAYIMLAEIYDLLGDEAHHEEVLNEMEAMPGGEKAAGMARASAMIRHGDVAGAERVLRALIDRYPTFPGLWEMLAGAQASANQNQEALLSFRRALESALEWGQGNPALYLHIAEMLHAMGRDREAFDQCRLVLALDPRNQTAQALKAELQNKLAARVPHL